MINFDSDQNNDLQVVNGNFSIQSGANDPSAFFNMNPSFQMNQQNIYNSAPSFNITGGFGQANFFGGQNHNNDQIVTPAGPAPQASQGPQCSGNCGACVWSFLCKKATANLTSIGGSAPKLC